MVTAPRIDSSSDERVPIVLGQNRNAEIFNPETNEWEAYQNLETSNWIAVQVHGWLGLAGLAELRRDCHRVQGCQNGVQAPGDIRMDLQVSRTLFEHLDPQAAAIQVVPDAFLILWLTWQVTVLPIAWGFTIHEP